MLSTLKKIIASLIISQILAISLYAQSLDGSKLESFGQFLSTFFDADHSLLYLADSFEPNQCRRRDLFAIHNAKDAISDTFLDNLRTLETNEIEQLKAEYVLLTAELVYIRNIDRHDTQAELDNAVLRESIIRIRLSNYVDQVRAALPTFQTKYEDRVEEYAHCPGSWGEVADNARNLIETANQLGQSAEALGRQFLATSEELINTPEGFLRNTSETLANGISNSFTQTAENFDEVATAFANRLSQIELEAEEDYLADAEAELSSARRDRSLAEILEEEDNLTRIPEILREQEAQYELDRESALRSAQSEITYTFTDDATFILWNDVLQLNTNLTNANNIIGNDSTGLTRFAEIVADRQCRL